MAELSEAEELELLELEAEEAAQQGAPAEPTSMPGLTEAEELELLELEELEAKGELAPAEPTSMPGLTEAEELELLELEELEAKGELAFVAPAPLDPIAISGPADFEALERVDPGGRAYAALERQTALQELQTALQGQNLTPEPVPYEGELFTREGQADEPGYSRPLTPEELFNREGRPAQALTPEELDEALKEGHLKHMLDTALRTDVERSVAVAELVRQTDLPESLVEQQFDAVKRGWEVARFSPKRLREESPILWNMLTERPEAARYALLPPERGLLTRFIGAVSRAHEVGARAQIAAATAQANVLVPSGMEAPYEPPTMEEVREIADPPLEPPQVMLIDPSATGGLTAKMSAAFQQSQLQVEHSREGRLLIHGILDDTDTADIERRGEERKKNLGPRYYAAGDLGEVPLASATHAPHMIEVTKIAGVVGVAGAVLGAVPGLLLRKSAVAKSGAMLGLGLSSRLGAGLASYELESGGAIWEMLEAKTDDGKRLGDSNEGRRIAAGAAMAYGLAAMAIEAATFGAELSMWGPLGDAIRRGSGAAFMKGWLANTSGREFFKSFAKRFRNGIAAEYAEEASQAVTKGVYEYSARVAKAGKLQSADPLKVLREADIEGTAAAKGIIGLAPVMGAVGVATQVAGGAVAGSGVADVEVEAWAQYVEQQQSTRFRLGLSERSAAVIEEIQALKDSVTAKADPVAIAELVGKTTGAKAIHVDAQAFLRNFQKEINRGESDLETVAKQYLGEQGPRKLVEAAATGAKVEVPLPLYVSRWMESGLAEKLKRDSAISADALTGGELEGFAKDVEAEFKRIMASEAPAAPPAAAVAAVTPEAPTTAVAAAAAPQAAPPAAAVAESNVASVPVMITRKMEEALRAAGFSQQDINAMTPQQAHDLLGPAAQTSAAPAAATAGAPEAARETAPGVTPEAAAPGVTPEAAAAGAPTPAAGPPGAAAQTPTPAPAPDDAAGQRLYQEGQAEVPPVAAAPGTSEAPAAKVSPEVEAQAVKIAEAVQATAAQDNTAADFIADQLEEQLLATGDFEAHEARTSVALFRANLRVVVARGWVDPKNLMRVEVAKPDITTEVRHIERAVELGRSGTRHIEYYRDTATGAYNEAAFREMEPPAGKPLTAHFSFAGIKAINDALGHDPADLLARTYARAFAAQNPLVARVGGSDFAVRVADVAEAERLRVAVLAALPEELRGFGLTAVVGKTLDEAAARHGDVKAAREALAGEAVLERPEGYLGPVTRRAPRVDPKTRKGGLPLEMQGVDLEKLKFPEDPPLEAKIPPHMAKRLADLSPGEYVREAYINPKTGVLTRLGWLALPRKRGVAAIDGKGIKALVEAGGEAAADLAIAHLQRIAEEVGGQDFDFTRLNPRGDEFAIQHEDPRALTVFLMALEWKLRTDPVQIPLANGQILRHVVEFRYGIAERDLHKADAELNRRKEAERLSVEARAKDVHGGGTEGGNRGGRGPGGSDPLDVGRGGRPGSERVGGAEAGGDPQRDAAAAEADPDLLEPGPPHLHPEDVAAFRRAIQNMRGQRQARAQMWLGYSLTTPYEKRTWRERTAGIPDSDIKEWVGDFRIVPAGMPWLWGVETGRSQERMPKRKRKRRGGPVPDALAEERDRNRYGSTFGYDAGEGSGGGLGRRRLFQDRAADLSDLGYRPAPEAAAEAEPGPVWHSAVAKAIEAAKQAKNTPEAWLAVIQKTPGVKAEELEWLGLKEWLAKQKGSVTREHVAEYVKAHQIEVTTETTGAPVKGSDAEQVMEAFERGKGAWTGSDWDLTGHDQETDTEWSYDAGDVAKWEEKLETAKGLREQLEEAQSELVALKDEPRRIRVLRERIDEARRDLRTDMRSDEAAEIQERLREDRKELEAFEKEAAEGLTEEQREAIDAAADKVAGLRDDLAEAERKLPSPDFIKRAAIAVGEIEESAKAAEKHAAKAIERFNAGDLEGALEAAANASRVERNYGDDPTWGPLLSALEEASETAGVPRYSEYALGGHVEGSYREIGFFAPGTPAASYEAPHFGEAGRGLLAHARISEHRTKDGRRVLFVEEIQSDLHQKGREKGYERRLKRIEEAHKSFVTAALAIGIPDGAVESFARAAARGDAQFAPDQQAALGAHASELRAAHLARMTPRRALLDEGLGSGVPGDVMVDIADKIKEGKLDPATFNVAGVEGARLEDLRRKAAAYRADRRHDITPLDDRAPDAPFKTTWEEMVAKRLIRLAAEEGFDTIGWTTGEQQARRYPEALAKQVDSIAWTRRPDGRYDVTATKAGAEVFHEESVTEQRLSDVLGKEMAQKVVAGGDTGSIQARDFTVGGEGMRIAYDKRIPGIFEKLVKRHGGKVAKARLQGEEQREDGHEVWTVSVPDSLRQMALTEGMPLFQDELTDQPRGWVDFIDDGKRKVAKIAILPTSDLSTFLHETGHVFMEMLNQMQAAPDAPPQLRRDYATLLGWMGATDLADLRARAKEAGAIRAKAEYEKRKPTADEKKKLKELSDPDEKLARGFERYLGSAEAPSAELVGPFTTYGLWLKDVYKDLTNLNVELTDDVKGVFDRMLATDAEVERHRKRMGLHIQLFDSPEDAGMSPEQWRAHTEEQTEATAHAVRHTQALAMRDRLQANEAWRRAKKKRLKRDYAAAYELEKAVLTRDALTAKDVALDRGSVEAVVGKEAGKRFRLRKDGGADPGEIAVALGYKDAPEMFQAVLAMPDKATWAEEKAEAQMRAEHPNVLADTEKLREAADQGLHSDKTAKWLRTRLEALHRRARFDPESQRFFNSLGFGDKMPPQEAIDRAAALLVERMTIEELAPERLLQRERSAAEGALGESLKGNYLRAFSRTLQQMTAMQMHRHAAEAAEASDAVVAMAGELSEKEARARLGLASPLYRDGVDAILEGLGLRDELPRDTALPSMGEVAAQMEADGATMLFRPEVLAKLLADGKAYEELTVAEMREVSAALKNIRGAARSRNTVIRDVERADKELTIEELVAAARRSTLTRDRGPVTSTEASESIMEQAGGWANSFDGWPLRIETMLGWLADKDLSNIWYEVFVYPLQAAKVAEADLRTSTVKPILEAMGAIPAAVRKTWMDPVDGDALFQGHRRDLHGKQDLQAPRRRFELLMMALHVGNPSNLERLTEGRNITVEQVRAALDLLTKEEIAYVQAILDAAESLKEPSFALEERDSGLRPKAIEAVPFQLKNGSISGYFPAAYDPRVEKVGRRQVGQAVADFLDPRYARPGTSHQHLKSRSENFTGALSLEPNAIQQHLFTVVHDITHREVVKSVGGLLLDERIYNVLRERLGPGKANLWLPWLRDVGQMRGAAVTGHDALLRWIRGNMAPALLGYRWRIAAADVTTLGKGLQELKPSHAAAAMQEFSRNPRAARRAALAKFGELRARSNQLTREFTQAMKKFAVGRTRRAVGFYKDRAFIFLEYSDAATATPLIMGAYRQAIADGRLKIDAAIAEGMPEKDVAIAEEKLERDAVRFAEAFVRTRLPSYSTVDMSHLLRDKGFWGTITIFQGFTNMVYNRMRDAAQPFLVAPWWGAEGRPGKARRLVPMGAALLGLLTAFGVLDELIMDRGPEEGEDWGTWAWRKYRIAALRPVNSEVASAVEAAILDKRVSPRGSPLTSFIQSIGEGTDKTADGDANAKKRVEAMIRALGALTGMPIYPPMTAVDLMMEE